MRLGLYTRISVDPNGTSDATERQEESCRAWAERNGHECTRLYTDRDISGYKDVQRPGFAALLSDAGREFDGINRETPDYAPEIEAIEGRLVDAREMFTEGAIDRFEVLGVFAVEFTTQLDEADELLRNLNHWRTLSRLGPALAGTP